MLAYWGGGEKRCMYEDAIMHLVMCICFVPIKETKETNQCIVRSCFDAKKMDQATCLERELSADRIQRATLEQKISPLILLLY